ncbi:MAG: energy-coupling factor ABC transporter ATP-binding protein, partial [Proteobacteria bacterium]|nr:energy-coupling factor ABC transporter ATP-binding protein [Pseudomonadota bacterium]
MAIAIDIKNLHFRYKNQTQWALKDINLELEKGKVLGVLGPGGSGKSTLCHLFNGIVPHAVDGEYLGEVRIFDQDIRQLQIQSLSKSVGRVLQDAEMQIVGRIVNEDVAFGMQNYLVNSEEIRQRVPEVLNQLGLSHLSNRPSDQLSGGEKQR